MKNLDFKMRERFHRREQDEDRIQAIQAKQMEKMKSKNYASDENSVSVDTPEQVDEFRARLKRFNFHGQKDRML